MIRKIAVLMVSVLFLSAGSSVFAAEQQDKDAAAKAVQQQFKPKEIKVDRNFDGTPDRIEKYNDKGVIVSVESDANNDGKMDEWVTYENGVPVKGSKDINEDGKPDTTLIYDGKGTVIKSEADSNGDGKIDEWVTYEAGKPVKAEKDTNKDGKPDTWVNY